MAEVIPAKAERFDQGKQTKLILAQEWVGPHTPPVFVQGVGRNGEGVVEMRNNDDVPGVASQGTRNEAGCVMGEIGDDHFDNLEGEPGGRGRARCRGLRTSSP